MRSIRLLPVAVVAVLAGCSRESEVIGTWAPEAAPISRAAHKGKAIYQHSVVHMRITFSKDHQFFMDFGNGADSKGTWRLEGSNVYVAFKPKDINGALVKLSTGTLPSDDLHLS